MPVLSIVLPFYNEAQVISSTLGRLAEFKKTLSFPVEFICVNDGSRDGTRELLDEAAGRDPDFKVVHLSRNFGHQAALTAGVDRAAGEFVVVMDGDLQDPPEVILEMVEKARQGADVVLARRRTRAGETSFKLLTARLFYWLMRFLTGQFIPENVGDFRLMNRRSLDALKSLRERHRFLRGMVAWIGFRQEVVEYDRLARVAGETKFPLRKMILFAWDAISSFSAFPLYLISFTGFLIFLFGIGYSLLSIYEAVVLKITVAGWASIVVLLCIFSGLILLSVGMVGLYVGKIFEEAKGRPLYIVAETRNLPHE